MKERLRIAVCEDDDTQRDYILSLVTGWAGKKGIPCETSGYISAEQLIFSFDGYFPYDIYILDIQMGKMNGMELARKIREMDAKASILFLTGVKDYALEGYEVGAVRYLLKPVREDEFFRIMDEMAEKEKETSVECFLLETGTTIQKIPFRDIWYVESQGHYLQMAFGDQKVQWKSSLGSVKDLFERHGFVMTRRGLLVNVGRISHVGKTGCVLDNGEGVPVSRSHFKAVNEAFIRYYKTDSPQ